VSAARDYRLSAEQCRRRADAAVDEVSRVRGAFSPEWLKFVAEAEQELQAASRSPRTVERWR
jgi:hypothetical protein